jgi:hypothetical protein
MKNTQFTTGGLYGREAVKHHIIEALQHAIHMERNGISGIDPNIEGRKNSIEKYNFALGLIDQI